MWTPSDSSDTLRRDFHMLGLTLFRVLLLLAPLLHAPAGTEQEHTLRAIRLVPRGQQPEYYTSETGAPAGLQLEQVVGRPFPLVSGVTVGSAADAAGIQVLHAGRSALVNFATTRGHLS